MRIIFFRCDSTGVYHDTNECFMKALETSKLERQHYKTAPKYNREGDNYINGTAEWEALVTDRCIQCMKHRHVNPRVINCLLVLKIVHGFI